MRARPTILSVAERAQVSKSLASRAIRGEPGVSEENRTKIFQAMKELNYHPNFGARSLRSSTQTIGIVLNDIGNPHDTQTVEGAEVEANTHDLNVIVSHGANSPTKLVTAVHSMLELKVEGIIVLSSWLPSKELARVSKIVPTVVISRYDNPPANLDTVVSDDVMGARTGCEHLLSVGAERIAYVTKSTSATSRAREQGMNEALTAVGKKLSVRYVESWDTSQFRSIVADREFDGILANNDMTAAQLLRVAHEEGVSVPKQLKIVGYDNTSTARVLYPSLTSIDQPQEAMGKKAISLLRERIAGREEAIHALFPPELIVRRSTTATG